MAQATDEHDLEVIPVCDAHGRPFLQAAVPRIDRQFHSSFHRVDNAHARLRSWREQLDLVLSHCAPTAQLFPDRTNLGATPVPNDDIAIRAAVGDAIAGGFAGELVAHGRAGVCGYVASPEVISETIDLDALGEDYRGWFAAAGVTSAVDRSPGDVERQVAWAIRDLSGCTYASHFRHLADPYRFAGLRVDAVITYGLVVGDDPARTCAWLLRHITGDDRWWGPLPSPPGP